MSRLVLLLSLLFSFNCFASEKQMLTLIEGAMGVGLSDFNKKTVESNTENCSVTAYKDKLMGYVVVKITKTVVSENGESRSWDQFHTGSNLTCSIQRDGNRLSFKCEGQECEEMGCTPVKSSMSLENKRFSIGKVSCLL